MSAFTPVGPRAPKEEFMRALNLSPTDARAEGVYRAMRDEAIGTYNQINSDRTNLKEEQFRDPSVQPPFFWHHVREDRREAAVRQTWQQARPGTPARLYFDQGQTNGDHRPNWVTLWLLYSVFRSRDIRNNRTRRQGGESSSVGGTGGIGGAGGATGTTVTKIYDPARNQYRPR